MSGKEKAYKSAILGVVVAVGLISGITIFPALNFFAGARGLLAVQITDQPQVPPGVTAVYITYSNIQVHMSSSHSKDVGWYDVSGSGSINLMSVVNVAQTIGAANIQPGSFNAIRFNVASATVTYDGVNYTAFVPSHTIIVPIENGGINVMNGQTSGMLVDLSPTVVATDSPTAKFIIIPTAHALPIPHEHFSDHDAQTGARVDLTNDDWFHHEEDALRGNISIQSVELTNTSLSILVKNIGSSSVTLNHIYMAGLENFSVSGQTIEMHHVVVPFTVLSNGTILVSSLSNVQPEFGSASITTTTATTTHVEGSTTTSTSSGTEPAASPVGYQLAPSASVTLTYHGPLNFLYIADGIVGQTNLTVLHGVTYYVGVMGLFDTQAVTRVTAS
jgi:hypothetical protein